MRSKEEIMLNAIYCLVEAMGMQAENEQRKYLGQSMAYTEDSFQILIRKYKEAENDKKM